MCSSKKKVYDAHLNKNLWIHYFVFLLDLCFELNKSPVGEPLKVVVVVAVVAEEKVAQLNDSPKQVSPTYSSHFHSSHFPS